MNTDINIREAVKLVAAEVAAGAKPTNAAKKICGSYRVMVSGKTTPVSFSTVHNYWKYGKNTFPKNERIKRERKAEKQSNHYKEQFIEILDNKNMSDSLKLKVIKLLVLDVFA